ncbi:ABC-2 type transport system ATP-binding protein [Aequitasia blattaphilus]|uniref:ABC transporter ATP-binding protein n=1 Tax=Aequitasia blattaphilus TaxID=2949332 RepID=A0ABT1E7N9_9FIRM|nr:ABC transporter ATP-binding protein [Aequitasia blattaphilus]MCP1101840.1 ABC transporter ATP-binding protein [Aequitasia blattaphilus]MCR8614480.1 ABC transporter ATP-binding protein [Aequitasia blattaphilus]
MKKIIEVSNLSKRYGTKEVVSDLSLSIGKGEVFGLLGHNGAGKTTTIEMILGIKKPDKGSAQIFGKEARKHRKSLFEKVGVQLQVTSFQNNIHVDEVCEELSVLYQEPADYLELLEKFNLSHCRKQPVDGLSGGERQKLSIILALIPNPEVVFFDELTTGLDAKARREVWELLIHLKKKGLTIFLTTHYMEEASALCDRLMIIKKGQMLTTGTVEEVIGYSPYENLEDAYLWYMEEK